MSNKHILVPKRKNSKNRVSNKEIVKKLLSRSKHDLAQKYQAAKVDYHNSIVDQLIYNERSHVVAKFKDFLIYEDGTEFLKRMYFNNELTLRLHKICEFYDNYSKIFPNYTVFKESKYIYKNIKRKQKLIDKHQNKDEDQAESQSKFFHTKTYNSLCTNKTRRTELSENSLENIICSIEKAEKDFVEDPKTKKLEIISNNNLVEILIPSGVKNVKIVKNENGSSAEGFGKMKQELKTMIDQSKRKIPKLLMDEKLKIVQFAKPIKTDRNDYCPSALANMDHDLNRNTISPGFLKTGTAFYSGSGRVSKVNSGKNSKEKKQSKENSGVHIKSQKNVVKTTKKINVNVVNIDLNKQSSNHKPTISMPKLNMNKIYNNYNMDKKSRTERSFSKISQKNDTKENSNYNSNMNSYSKLKTDTITNTYESIKTETKSSGVKPLPINAVLSETDTSSKISPFKPDQRKKKSSPNKNSSSVNKLTEFFKSFKSKPPNSVRTTNTPLTSRNVEKFCQGNDPVTDRLFTKNTSNSNIFKSKEVRKQWNAIKTETSKDNKAMKELLPQKRKNENYFSTKEKVILKDKLEAMASSKKRVLTKNNSPNEKELKQLVKDDLKRSGILGKVNIAQTMGFPLKKENFIPANPNPKPTIHIKSNSERFNKKY